MSNVVRLRESQQSGEGEIENIPALVPPGRYTVKFSHWSTFMPFPKRTKLALYCAICDFGDAFGTLVPRFYNVRAKGKLGKNGSFTAAWGSQLLKDYAAICGMAKRNDRIALTRYRNLILSVDIETVKIGREQRDLPTALQYSVIRKIRGIEVGNIPPTDTPTLCS